MQMPSRDWTTPAPRLVSIGQNHSLDVLGPAVQLRGKCVCTLVILPVWNLARIWAVQDLKKYNSSLGMVKKLFVKQLLFYNLCPLNSVASFSIIASMQRA